MSASELRISDAEREQAVTALGEHYVAGRLTKEEYDERSSAAWAARTASALAPLFRDLPPLPEPAAVPARPRERSRPRRRLAAFPLVALLVLAVALTPFHLPWWGWMILAWLWFSGVLTGVAGGCCRPHRRR